ncbi:MAG: tRNA threonylcarbamoyladenosine dehydratase [Lachnospiraceae bacterium]|nr:tRNA threonylcarbamoyladenosine dehydratase [Lachnospiraceae bacterium]
MEDMYSRTRLLIGDWGLDKIKKAKVLIFGIGGVGGYVCEALARSGVGSFTLVDNDTVSITNINRQIIATTETVGRYKTEVMAERIKSINPDIKVETKNMFYLPENAGEFDFSKYDYIVDAVDTVTAKLEIIVNANKAGTLVISSMGAGNKLCATGFTVADIYDTKVCPLAKVMRRELKKRGIKKQKVVYSPDEVLTPVETISEGTRRQLPGSISYVPAVCGLITAGEIISDLIKLK